MNSIPPTRHNIDYTKTSYTNDEITKIKREVELVRQKYPRHIPVIVRSKGLKISKSKFLVTGDVTVGQFMFILRKKIESPTDSANALFMFVNNKLPQSTAPMSFLYTTEKDPRTGMLFITLCKENTFG